jgi:hypothetical protein
VVLRPRIHQSGFFPPSAEPGLHGFCRGAWVAAQVRHQRNRAGHPPRRPVHPPPCRALRGGPGQAGIMGGSAGGIFPS